MPSSASAEAPAPTAPEPAPAAPDPVDPRPLPAWSDEEGGWPDSAGARSAMLADWKDAMCRDFDVWLADLPEIPDAGQSLDEADDEPDLYSFYEQMAAGNIESRKANRRTAEAFSQWSETLARFEGSLAPLRETAAQLAAARPKDEGMSRAHCLVLVEVLDRMRRLAQAFQSPPVAKPSWWRGGADGAWRGAWESQRQALDILAGHLEGLLRKEGVTRIDTAGQPFDPAVMIAVAAEPDTMRPPQTVLEEVGAGYRRRGELLRAAQVKVTRAP